MFLFEIKNNSFVSSHLKLQNSSSIFQLFDDTKFSFCSFIIFRLDNTKNREFIGQTYWTSYRYVNIDFQPFQFKKQIWTMMTEIMGKSFYIYNDTWNPDAPSQKIRCVTLSTSAILLLPSLKRSKTLSFVRHANKKLKYMDELRCCFGKVEN